MRIFSDSHYWLSRVLLVTGIYALAVGGMWISSRYFAADVFQGVRDITYLLDHYRLSYERHYQSILWVLRLSIVLISIIYIYLILRNDQGLPRWVTIFNPALLLGLIISTLIWAKPLGVHLAPAAMNVTHFIFFVVLLHQYRRCIGLGQELI